MPITPAHAAWPDADSDKGKYDEFKENDINDGPQVAAIPGMHSPYLPLHVSRVDPRGKETLTYNVPGNFDPPRPWHSPLSWSTLESFGANEPHSFKAIAWTWLQESDGKGEQKVKVDLFKSGMMPAADKRGRGIIFSHSAEWKLKDVAEYYHRKRNPGPNGKPVQDKSLLPLIAGPITSKFRPACIVNLDNFRGFVSFPDTDDATMLLHTSQDPHFRSTRYAGLQWATSDWKRAPFHVWVLVENESSASLPRHQQLPVVKVRFFVVRNLNASQRQLFAAAGRQADPSKHAGANKWLDDGSDYDYDVMDVKGTGMIFIPPGARYKMMWMTDALITVGHLAMVHRRNCLPALPTRYDAAGAMYDEDSRRLGALQSFISGHAHDHMDEVRKIEETLEDAQAPAPPPADQVQLNNLWANVALVNRPKPKDKPKP